MTDHEKFLNELTEKGYQTPSDESDPDHDDCPGDWTIYVQHCTDSIPDAVTYGDLYWQVVRVCDECHMGLQGALHCGGIYENVRLFSPDGSRRDSELHEPDIVPAGDVI